MTSGHIQSITPDVRGDTLAAAVVATDKVLPVTDTADFDEADTDDRWLVIATSAPMRYVAVDHDAATVTLADPVGAAFEAGLPVSVWDMSVHGGGAVTVEYEATVMTERGPVPAIIPHGLIPLAGVDNLVGASVALGVDDNGADIIEHVYGRAALIDGSVIETPNVTLYLPADTSPVPNNTWTDIAGWAVLGKLNGIGPVGADGFVTLQKTGRYLATSTTLFGGSSTTGRRRSRFHKHPGGLANVVSPEYRAAPSDDGEASPFGATDLFLTAGDRLGVAAFQTSGAGLALRGDANGLRTTFSLTYLGPT